MTTQTLPSWVFVQGQIADLKAMTAFKDLQIRKASLSEADFSVVAILGDTKLLEKIETHSTVSDSIKTTAEAATDTEPQADSKQAATSMNNSATTVEASDICGCAIHVLKPEQLKAVEAFQGSCQKLIEGQIKSAASVNRKGKHFPEESMSGLVFVFDRDPEGILSDLKWLKFPIWICPAGAPDGFSMLMHRHPPPMLCRLGKVSGFSMKAFIWPPAFRAKFPDAPSANPTWIPDVNALGEEDILASLVGSVSELDIAMNMYFGSEMTMSLADCEMELLADQDIPAMRVQGKMMVFGGNRKKLLPEHLCRDAYRKTLERAGWFGSET